MVDGPNTRPGASAQKPVGEGVRSALVPVQILHPPTGERNVLDMAWRLRLVERQNARVRLTLRGVAEFSLSKAMPYICLKENSSS